MMFSLADFVQGYTTAALWADCDPLDGGETGGLEHLQLDDESLRAVVKLCNHFYDSHMHDLEAFVHMVQPGSDYSQSELAGHCFRLSTGGHGTGFLDHSPSDSTITGMSVFKSTCERLELACRTKPWDNTGGGDCYQIDENTARLEVRIHA